MDPRRFTRAVIAATVAVLTAVGAMNIYVDPLAEFGISATRPLVRAARRARVEMVEANPAARVFIIGSSRSMKVEPAYVEQFLGKPAMNVAVNSPGAEDYYVMLRFLLDVAEPEVLIVGVDEAAFHASTPIHDQLYGAPELARYLPLRERLRQRWSQFESALAFGTTVSTLRWLNFTVNGFPAAKFSYDEQGLLTYRTWEAEIREGTFDFETLRAKTILEYQGRFDDFEELAAWRVDYFGKFLALAEQNDVTVYLYTTPLHPQMEVWLQERGIPLAELREDVAVEVAEQAKDHGATFFDAARHSVGDEYFDGAHPREPLNRRILDVLLGEPEAGHAL